MRKKAARIAGALAAVLIVGVMFIRTTFFSDSAEDAGEIMPVETVIEKAVFPYAPLAEGAGIIEYPEIVTDRFRAVFSSDGGVMTALELLTDDGTVPLFSDGASGGNPGRILAGGNIETPLSGIYRYARPDGNTIVFTGSYTEQADSDGGSDNADSQAAGSGGSDSDGGSDGGENPGTGDRRTVFSVNKTYRFDPEENIWSLSISFTGDTSGIRAYAVQLPGNLTRFVVHTRKGKSYPSYDGDIIRTPANAAWEGMEDSRFAFILINGSELEGRLEYLRDEGLRFSVSEDHFSGGNQDLRFFTGPKSGMLLAQYETEIPGISSLAYPAGFLKPLVRFFSALLRQLRFRLIPDYGLVIILLALLVKLTFLSVSGKSIASSESVRRLQPEITAIRNNSSLDPFIRKQKISELYRENRVKPLYGVLNLLIHLLVFVTITRIFTDLYDFKDASSHILSIPRLADPDRLFTISGFSIRLLPILVLVATFIQSRILQAPDSGDRAQTIMSWAVPFLLIALFYRMPSAAVLYWLSQTLFSMTEILIFRKRKAE